METVDIRSGKKALSDLAYDAIIKSIYAHELMPGVSLRSKELAARFGISPTPIERALERLAGEGLVEFVPGLGPRVSTPDSDEVLDLYYAREMIELFAIERGFCNIDETYLHRLEALIRAYEEAVGTMETRPEAQLEASILDTDLHQHLITLWPSPTIQSWCHRLHVHTKSYYLAYIPGYWREGALVEHHQILAALKSRDLDASLGAVRRHNAENRESFLARLRIVEKQKGEPLEKIPALG
jgi:DNA-binding GntR family transcriptional regulator